MKVNLFRHNMRCSLMILVVNIGPQHPSTHGVLRLQTVLDGETVTKIYPHLGYIHRGIEKLCEQFTYPQTLALTDRMNYLSAMMHRHALVGVIEEGMGIELSERILYIRTIMDELQRIDNHLLYTSCCAQDLGALTAFLYGMRDREHVLNVMEETTGGRLIQNYYRIGGLQADIDPNSFQMLRSSASTCVQWFRSILMSLVIMSLPMSVSVMLVLWMSRIVSAMV